MFDAKGNLYGTTYYGGQYDYGTVFEIAKAKETTLHSFDPNDGDGVLPLGGVVFDKNGNLFGPTSSGGATSEFVLRVAALSSRSRSPRMRATRCRSDGEP